MHRTGLADIVLTGTQVVDVRSGEIRTTGGASLRQANDDPAVDQIKNNVAFRVENGIAIFIAKNITFSGAVSFEGTEGGNVGPTFATLPVMFVATNDLHINALLDLPCGRLGGGSGGIPGVNNGAGGGGGGGATNASLTGSGGGHGTSGGQAGASTSSGTFTVGAQGGVANNATFVLAGGSGGAGGAGGSGANAKNSRGGAGGGAIAFVAGNTLWLGDGKSPQGVNASGCGGGVFTAVGTVSATGSGGGSGGFIGLEAPVIRAAAQSGLAANGGGGAGSDTTTGKAGQSGKFSGVSAAGGGAGTSPACNGVGGHGAASETPTSGLGGNGKTQAEGCSDSRGGGGGGGIGRIVISSLSGDLTVDANATTFFTSPARGTAAVKLLTLTAEP